MSSKLFSPGDTPGRDLIHEAEVSFLQSCVSDLQQALLKA